MESFKTIGLETLKKTLASPSYVSFDYSIIEEDESFRVQRTRNEKYVHPIFSIVSDYTTVSDINEASIVLISAVGATGKTELTKYLSVSIGCPIIDLARTKVVAGNSITGLLFKKMAKKDSFVFLDNISCGNASFIIDALDEGLLKTNYQGFYDFLEDIISFQPKQGAPIVMLGRGNAVELAAAFLFEKGVNIATLQIEPFTKQKAIEFLDNYVSNSSALRFQSIYQETRDYIIEKIGGFFKDQGDIKNHQYERFIGYAPVLQSIATFFDENNNYQQILAELKQSDVQSVFLIKDIIERILKRDRDQKVFPGLVYPLLEERSIDFKEEVLKTAYSDEEQCARLLYLALNKDFPGLSLGDPSFENGYNDGITTWIKEHPFIAKSKITNIVFESYVLAKLINNSRYQQDAIDYIRSKGDVSYMFFYLFRSINESESVDNKIIPILYSSLCALNTSVSFYGIEMGAGDISNGRIECAIRFASNGNEDLPSYCYTTQYTQNDYIDLGPYIANIDIDIPLLPFVFSEHTVHCYAPAYIKCKTLVISSCELVFHKGTVDDKFIIECQDHQVKTSSDKYLKIINPAKTEKSFILCSPKQPDYPLFDYWEKNNESLENETEDFIVKYSKLRRIILFFRSHSKGEFARHHELIDFVLGNTPVGKSVIQALLKSGIMYRDAHLYKLRTDVMSRVLGLSYDGFRSFEQTEALRDFLKKVDSNN